MNDLTNSKCELNSYTGAANYSSGCTAYTKQSEQIITSVFDPIPQDTVFSDVGKYSIYEIADWFLKKADMTHKKIQKLCYYAQAWGYALKGYRLIDSDFQAWTHGPVSPALWEKFKSFRFDTISLKNKNLVIKIDPEDESLLENVWETYGDRTGNALEALSHREMPWIEARKGYAEGERCNIVISPENMKDYYRSIYIGS